MENKRGRLIVLEGLDRVGKTTQEKLLREHLAENGVPCEPVKFPDRTTASGKVLDEYLRDPSKKMNKHALHLLFASNRWEQADRITSLLEQGTTVVMDRYWYTGVAFSVATGLDFDWCLSTEKGLPDPDLVFYLELADGLAEKRGGYGDERYESSAFQAGVKRVYERLKQPSWKLIDASQSVAEVRAQIIKHL